MNRVDRKHSLNTIIITNNNLDKLIDMIKNYEKHKMKMRINNKSKRKTEVDRTITNLTFKLNNGDFESFDIDYPQDIDRLENMYENIKKLPISPIEKELLPKPDENHEFLLIEELKHKLAKEKINRKIAEEDNKFIRYKLEQIQNILK